MPLNRFAKTVVREGRYGEHPQSLHVAHRDANLPS